MPDFEGKVKNTKISQFHTRLCHYQLYVLNRIIYLTHFVSFI